MSEERLFSMAGLLSQLGILCQKYGNAERAELFPRPPSFRVSASIRSRKYLRCRRRNLLQQIHLPESSNVTSFAKILLMRQILAYPTANF